MSYTVVGRMHSVLGVVVSKRHATRPSHSARTVAVSELLIASHSLREVYILLVCGVLSVC